MCKCHERLPRLILGRAALRPDSRVDGYINMDRLIRDNCEWLRSHVQVPEHAAFYIENIIARRKGRVILSVSVHSNSRDLFSLSSAQNDQRIVSIAFRYCCRRFGRGNFIVELDRLRETIFKWPSMKP